MLELPSQGVALIRTRLWTGRVEAQSNNERDQLWMLSFNCLRLGISGIPENAARSERSTSSQRTMQSRLAATILLSRLVTPDAP